MHPTEDSAITSLKHMIRISFDSVMIAKSDPNLSPNTNALLSSTILCLQQMNRILNLWEFLADSDKAALQQEFQYYEIESIVENITNTFYKTLIDFVPIDIKISFDLKDTALIVLDKSRFELSFLNLLYCSLKTRDSLKPEPIKINISVTENRDNIVFHIKDNCKKAPVHKEPSVFVLSRPNYSILNGWSHSSLFTLSLKTAQTATEQMNGSVVYTSLKSGNRYDIYLPKHQKAAPKLQAVAKYEPNRSYYNEIFADFILEKNLTNVVNAFDFADGMKL